MQFVKVLSIAISLLMSATGLKAETPTVDELSNGITAFLCEDYDGLPKNLPLIFTQSEGKWVLNSGSSVSVSKIEKGFMMNFPPPNQGIGILSANQNGSWKLEYLGEKDSFCAVAVAFSLVVGVVVAVSLLAIWSNWKLIPQPLLQTRHYNRTNGTLALFLKSL